jgi:hypothetical protein
MSRTKLILTALAAVALAPVGCGGFDGPRRNATKPRPDLPEYSIEEQRRRARDKYALPEDDFRTGPPSFVDRPSPIGR